MQFLVSGLIILFVTVFIESKLNNIREGNLLSSLRINFNLINIVCISISFASLMLIISLLLEYFNVFESVRGNFEVSCIPYILYSITFVPFVEEYFYRFLPYRIIINPKYYLYVAGISSLVFSFSHIANNSEYVFIFIMAIMLSFISIKTKNILYSFGCHSVYNFFVLLNYYFNFDNILVLFILLVFSIIILFRGFLLNKLKR